MKKFKLPKGTYFLGDPCYAIQDYSRWQDIVSAMYDSNHDSEADIMRVSDNTGTCEGHIFYGSTAFGDGEYYDEHGNAFGVDAGLIGLVPMSVAFPDGMNLSECGKIVDFANDIDIEWDDGKFWFGSGDKEFSINTLDTEEDEDENDEDWLFSSEEEKKDEQLWGTEEDEE